MGEETEGRLLDGFFLLAAAGASLPAGVVTANVGGLEIMDIAAEYLAFFTNLDSIDLSDNDLSYSSVLEQLSWLPRVSKISLPCNLISAIVLSISGDAFQHLRELDLSSNELHGDVLTQLSCLRRLQKLDLSNNCVSSIPPDLYGLNRLEELNLSSNDLVQFDQWRALDSLPRLARLNLASNRIKRLKDDQVEPATCMFAQLLELDLSSNDITTHEAISLLQCFPSLASVVLTGNVLSPKDRRLVPSRIELVQRPTGAAKGCHLSRKLAKARRVRASAPASQRSFRKVAEAVTVARGHHALLYDGETGYLQLAQQELATLLEGPDEPEEEQAEARVARARAIEDRPAPEQGSFLRPLPFTASADVQRRLDEHHRPAETFLTEPVDAEAKRPVWQGRGQRAPGLPEQAPPSPTPPTPVAASPEKPPDVTQEVASALRAIREAPNKLASLEKGKVQ